MAVGGGWWLVIGGWWRLAVVGGWRLVAAGGWRQLVVGGGWRLVVVGGPWGRSLKPVLSTKKIWFLKDRPGTSCANVKHQINECNAGSNSVQ